MIFSNSTKWCRVKLENCKRGSLRKYLLNVQECRHFSKQAKTLLMNNEIIYLSGPASLKEVSSQDVCEFVHQVFTYLIKLYKKCVTYLLLKFALLVIMENID